MSATAIHTAPRPPPEVDIDKLLAMGGVAWTPQKGSQEVFLTCPIFEVLYEGTRGPGKTDALLMDFAQHCGRGHGAAWRGVLFRQTYKQLQDVIAKSKKTFYALPEDIRPRYVGSPDYTWTWPTGEQLLLRQMRVPDEYWNYHGHEYPWIAFEELTSWPDDQCYKRMMSCSRAPPAPPDRETGRPMPRKYRATTNPYGVGHNWVKLRFRLPQMRGKVIREGKDPPRVAIYGHLQENKLLLRSDPEYIDRLKAAARNPSELLAWTEGRWDIMAGGMFDDLWDARTHIVDPFPIPSSWRIDRAMDWGSSKPFSIGWYAESNGESPIDPLTRKPLIHTVRGDLFRIREWYGWNGRTPNEGIRKLARDVAEGIKERERKWGLFGHVRPGVGDNAIWTEENGMCVGKDFEDAGIHWEQIDKSKGSRVQGWEATRKFLAGALNLDADGVRLPPPREFPGLYVFRGHNPQFERIFPVTPRDDDDLDDVNDESEDHLPDEVRYRVRRAKRGVRVGTY